MSGLAVALASAVLALSAQGESRVAPPAPRVVSPAGSLVTAIELRSATTLDDPQALLSLVDLAVGQPWTDSQVRHTLRNLYLTGSVSEAEVYAVPTPAEGDHPAGVRAVIAVWPNLEVKRVTVTGKLGLPRADLQHVLEVKVTEPLVEDRVLRSVNSLQDLYQANGYFAAQVRLEVKEPKGSSAAEITFHVDAGFRSRIGSVGFAGDLGDLHAVDIVKQLQAWPDKAYKAAAARGRGPSRRS